MPISTRDTGCRRFPYLTGGSVASSIFGIPQATQDIDLVIDLPPAKVKDFVQSMRADFFIDSDTVMQAVRRCSSFNAIHFETVQKVDFFVRRHDDYAREEMRRRVEVTVDEVSQSEVFIASPEDIILQKLIWYKMGARVSERQWNNVLGLIRVQGERLDRGHLNHWGRELGIMDLIEDAWLVRHLFDLWNLEARVIPTSNSRPGQGCCGHKCPTRENHEPFPQSCIYDPFPI